MSLADAFRDVMAGVPTPVSVVTTLRDGRLLGSAGWLACTVASLVDGGDHVVVLGTVVRADAAGGPPLTDHARTFGTHRPADTAA